MKTRREDIHATCPLLRLFAPLGRREEATPDWSELELRRVERADAIELRILRGGAPVGSMHAVRAMEENEWRLFGVPTGPVWCRSLLHEAASEWMRTREEASRGTVGGRRAA